jgi:hypothetical protein
MKMQKLSWVMVTGWLVCLSLAGPALAQRLVVVNGERWSPAQVAAFEQQCGPMLDGVYRVQGDYWWNVYNPLHAGRVSELCGRHQRARTGPQLGQDTFWHSNATGASGNSNGQCSYINIPGTGSVMTGNCD